MILQIFGPYGEIGIMRTSEAGNEAAEGGREGEHRGLPAPGGILRGGRAAGSAWCSRGDLPRAPATVPRCFPLAPPLSRCSGRPRPASGGGEMAWDRCPCGFPWENRGSGSPRRVLGCSGARVRFSCREDAQGCRAPGCSRVPSLARGLIPALPACPASRPAPRDAPQVLLWKGGGAQPRSGPQRGRAAADWERGALGFGGERGLWERGRETGECVGWGKCWPGDGLGLPLPWLRCGEVADSPGKAGSGCPGRDSREIPLLALGFSSGRLKPG